MNVGFGCVVVLNCVQPVVAFRYSHFHEVGVPVELSVNVTESGAVPERGVPVKFATVGTPSVAEMV